MLLSTEIKTLADAGSTHECCQREERKKGIEQPPLCDSTICQRGHLYHSKVFRWAAMASTRSLRFALTYRVGLIGGFCTVLRMRHRRYRANRRGLPSQIFGDDDRVELFERTIRQPVPDVVATE